MTDKDEDEVKKKLHSKKVEIAKDMINKYRSHYAGIDPEVLFNLNELKKLSSQPQSPHPDQAYENIKKHLGEDESGETLRQERWKSKVRCLSCGSKNIRRLPAEQQKAKNIYKYKCLDCEEEFNDDSETEIEKGVPPLYSWMFCWYLLGCTTSLQYIAHKLGLDITTVEMMVSHMQKIFKAQHPLSNFNSFDEWSIRQGGAYKKVLQESLQKTDEMLKGYSVGQAIDDHEVKRQKERAEHPLKPKPTRGG